MATCYSEGKEANGKTAETILDRLEERNNYIPPSARREYKSAVLKAYRDYVEARNDGTCLKEGSQEGPRKKGK